MTETAPRPAAEAPPRKVDRDGVFVEFTKSICPVCRVVVDAQVNIRDNKVYLRVKATPSPAPDTT